MVLTPDLCLVVTDTSVVRTRAPADRVVPGVKVDDLSSVKLVRADGDIVVHRWDACLDVRTHRVTRSRATKHLDKIREVTVSVRIRVNDCPPRLTVSVVLAGQRLTFR